MKCNNAKCSYEEDGECQSLYALESVFLCEYYPDDLKKAGYRKVLSDGDIPAAIAELSSWCFSVTEDTDPLKHSLYLAISALQKQISQKVIHQQNGNHECPSCNYQATKGRNYCWMCGQKLHW